MEFNAIGKSLPRTDGYEKVKGKAIYVADIKLPGMLYAKILRSEYAHAKIALESGLSEKEINDLSSGIFHNCPPEEVPALLYAQHWAEENGQPDPETRQEVVDIYDESMVEAMELAMRMIRMGNLLGNTWDYVLFRLSFGRLGNR